jgi:Bacterial pre-peptidase C-terminal domain
MIDYVLPRGGARGSTVTAEFHGRSLENPKEILFYGPGITAAAFTPFAKPTDGFKVKFQIAPDCPLGEHVLRVRTATALSDAVTFWVGPFPQIPEAETKLGENDSMAKAQPIPMNVTVEGQILPGPDLDRDYYRVQARQGQRISVEVEAARLGTLHFGGENDLAVRILDANDKELGRNDDSALYVQDPVLSIVAPKDGAYFIEIQQQIFYPPRQAWYRAHIGDFSRPTAIFPAGGQAGTTIEARVLGDPTGERTEQIALPSKPGNFDYFAGAPNEHPPSANVLRVSAYPNFSATGLPAGRRAEGAEQPAPTLVPSLPAALNGILLKPNQIDTFQFSAKKGQSWNIRVFARTLGAPVDARITLRASSNPKLLFDVDDSRLVDLGLPSGRGSWYIKDQQDPITVFRVPADGDYLLSIQDSENGAGPDHVYRIEIEPHRNVVYTHVTGPDGYQMPRFTGFIVPQGGRWTLDVQLAQGIGNDYKGEIELEARGLPRGVTMIAPKFGKGVTRMSVQFVAAADAQPQSALIELLAKPVDKGAQLDSGSRQGFALTNRPGELPWHFVWLNQYALAVTQPAPFDIELEQPALPIVQGGDLTLKARIVRHGDFKDAVEMIADWLPSGVSKGNVVTIPAGKDEAVFQIQANDKAAKGVYQIAMNASTVGGDGYSGVGRVRVSSKFVDLKVMEPYLSIDMQRGSVEQGKSAQVVANLHQIQPFEGKATVRLQQLPKGVKMLDPAPAITTGDTQVTFQVAADKDALAGLYKGIVCEIAFTEAGQTFKQHSGSGVLRVDEARIAEALK